MPAYMGPHTSIRTELDVPVPMRDGARLYADIYRPDAGRSFFLHLLTIRRLRIFNP